MPLDTHHYWSLLYVATWITAGVAYFSNVDKSTHEILVAEGIYGLLGLFPCCVFHNPKDD